MARTLITNGTVLTLDGAAGPLPGTDVLVEDGRILAIGPALGATRELGDAERIDASGAIVMPGLVNAHLHTWQTALRGVAADWGSPDYFRIIHGVVGPACTPEDIHVATLAGALSQIECGVTTLFDWNHGNRTPDHSDAGIDALEEAGIRAVFGHGTVKPLPRAGEPHFSQVPHPRAEIERLRRGRLSQDDARVTLAACILGPDYSTLEVCLTDFRLAREFGLLSSAHAWGNRNRLVPGGYRTVAEAGLLGPDHNMVHGTYMQDDEVAVIVDSGASVTSTAAAEMHGQVHAPLSGRVRALGGHPSIGPDTEVLNNGSMFDCMRAALMVQRMYDNRATVARLERTDAGTGAGSGTRTGARSGGGAVATSGSAITEVSVTSRDVLDWATVNNARALRLHGRIGTLAPGKQADLIVVRRDGLGMVGAPDPVQAVVHFAQPADVDLVMVGGRVLKRDGKLAYAGLAALRDRLHASTERLRALAV